MSQRVGTQATAAIGRSTRLGLLCIGAVVLTLSWLWAVGPSVMDPASYSLTTCGNTLLAAAAAVYLANLWFREDAIGRWGSRLAALAALAIGVSLIARCIEVWVLPPAAGVAYSFLYELIVTFTLVTVVVYLILEALYRTRFAGAFVLPAALIGVACEIWLVGNGVAQAPQPPPLLAGYWGQSVMLANMIACAALGVAALNGGAYLVRQGRGQDCERLQEVMCRAVAIGFAVLLLMAGLGAFALGHGTLPAPGANGLRMVGAAAVSAGCLYHARRTQGASTARFAIAGFGATLFMAWSVPGGLS